MKFFLLALMLMTAACASNQKSTSNDAYDSWYQSVRQKQEPVWKSLMRKEIAQEKSTGTLQKDLNAYTVRLHVAVDGKGKILSVTNDKPSGVDAVNRIALQTFQKDNSVPAPPASLIKDGQAKLVWEFKIVK